MTTKKTELQTFLKTSPTNMYRHGDKNRTSPLMRIIQKAAGSIVLASTVGCSIIDHVQYGTTASDFDQMTDKVETTLPKGKANDIHVLSLQAFKPYKNMKTTMKTAEKFNTEIEKQTGAHIHEAVVLDGYSSFQNGLPVTLSMINKINDKQKECLIIPLDHRKTADVKSMMLPMEVNKFLPAFDNISLHTFNNSTNYHEAWHCSFFANLEKHLARHDVPEKNKQNVFDRSHYVTHIGEVLSDTAAAAEVIHSGISSNIDEVRSFQHMRTLYVSQGHYVSNSYATPTASYYTAPAIEAMTDYIADIGIEKFRAMPDKDVASKIIEIAAENTQTYDSFLALRDYTAHQYPRNETRLADKIINNHITDAAVQTVENYKTRLKASTKYAENKMPEAKLKSSLTVKPR